MIANPNDGNSPRVEVATPTIDVSAGGLITAKTEQEKGYVPGGTKSATQQLTTQGAKTVTPGTSNQTAVASGRYTTGDVVVSGDANLVPENIAEGVSIFGVDGTHSGEQPKYTVTNVETNLSICNVFYPKLASPGQYVVTIKGEYNYHSEVFVDGSDKPIAFTEAERYDYLPPLVKAEVDKQKQENPDALDVPVTRAPPITAPGYLWFVMPAENVTTKNGSY